MDMKWIERNIDEKIQKIDEKYKMITKNYQKLEEISAKYDLLLEKIKKKENIIKDKELQENNKILELNKQLKLLENRIDLPEPSKICTNIWDEFVVWTDICYGYPYLLTHWEYIIIEQYEYEPQNEYVANENRFHYSPEQRLKTAEEMVKLFADLPEAVANTVQIAKRCNFLLEFVPPLLPIFECPNGKTENEYIREQAYSGLKQRMEASVYTKDMTEEQKKEIDERYYSRLEYELSVIEKMGFAGYFLIVSDFICWSKNHGVPVGPGRGSGAGSIVAWSLFITELDPLKLDLLFERFLNPERVNMPDFDVDFCQENRYKTIEYVQNKYGIDHVAQIITYGKLQSKAVIRDVARVLQMPYSQADKLSKMIPPPVQGKNVTLKESLEQI